MATKSNSEKSIAELLSDLSREFSTLLRQEFGLMKTEASEKLTQGVHGLISLAVGGAIAYAGLLVLLFAAVFGLALVMELWLAALIVAAVVLIIGMILIGKAKKNLKAHNLMPRRSMESIKSDTRVAGEHIKQGGKA